MDNPTLSFDKILNESKESIKDLTQRVSEHLSEHLSGFEMTMVKGVFNFWWVETMHKLHNQIISRFGKVKYMSTIVK